MIANPDFKYMSLEEYLEWEEKQEIKYEYVDGKVFAMTGGSIPHNIIALNLASALRNHLRNSLCRAYIADVKLAVSEKGAFYYPDVMVTCDKRDRQALKFIQYPCLIAEILSPTTEAYDRGSKFTHYRRIETLKEYLLIDSQKISVECFRLNERRIWELHPYEENDEIHLTSVDFHFPISLLYEDINFPLNEEL